MINGPAIASMYQPTGVKLKSKTTPISAERQIEYNIWHDAILKKITSEAISTTELSKLTGYGKNTVRNHILKMIEDREVVRVYPGKKGIFVKAVE